MIDNSINYLKEKQAETKLLLRHFSRSIDMYACRNLWHTHNTASACTSGTKSWQQW